jgi:hypothetical protein
MKVKTHFRGFIRRFSIFFQSSKISHMNLLYFQTQGNSLGYLCLNTCLRFSKSAVNRKNMCVYFGERNTERIVSAKKNSEFVLTFYLKFIDKIL